MRILFVHLGLASFVQKDLDVLESAHNVQTLHFLGAKSAPRLWEGVRWCDLTFSWFGTVHALFAVGFSKLLGKKSVVVSGGYDVAQTPLLPSYGALSKPHKRWGIRFVFRNADLVLSVSESNRRETVRNARASPAKVKLLYHGFDSQLWRPADGVRKEDLVLTVGSVSKHTLRKKGLDLFVRSATELPDIPFVLVGPWQDSAVTGLKAIAPPNVIFTDALYGEDLVRMYSQAKVYVQASIHESFGCSVAEAMLCECVPVVSQEAALPEVVGDCGFYVGSFDPKHLATQIKRALGSDLGDKSRARVKRLFPLRRRERGLLAAIQEV